MAIAATKRFFTDQYYWRSALLIAQCNMARQYRNSYLGVVWLLLQPLAMMSIYTLIMPLIMNSDARSYALYLLSTLPLWQYMATSLTQAPNTLIGQAETLKRCMISSSIFPVAEVMRNSYSYTISFTVMALLALALGLPVSWHILLWPVYFIPVMFAMIAACIGIAFIAPYVRDIGDAIVIAMNVLLWGSAVIYPLNVLPPNVAHWVSWNPFTILLSPMVALVYEHRVPDMLMTVKLLGVMLLAMGVGYTLYRLGRKNYVYYL